MINPVRLLAILGACAFSLGSPCLADDSQPPLPKTATTASDEPTAQDLKQSKQRGIFFKVPGSDAPLEDPTAAAKANSTAKKIKTRPNGRHKVQVHQTKAAASASVTSGTSGTSVASVTSGTTKTAQHAKAKPATKTATLHSPSRDLVPVTKLPVSSSAAAGGGGENLNLDQGTSIIKAWLNKRGKVPTYKDGEKMEVSVNASKDCNLAIYDYDGTGTLTQLFPNEYQKDSAVKAGDTVTIGGVKSSFDFQVSLSGDTTNQQERLFVFAYPEKDEAPISVAMSKVGSSPFRSGPITPDQYRKLVNESTVFYGRNVTVKAKNNAFPNIQTVANEINDGNTAPNKMELCFKVEK